jgi:hypothetical protein
MFSEGLELLKDPLPGRFLVTLASCPFQRSSAQGLTKLAVKAVLRGTKFSLIVRCIFFATISSLEEI